MPGAIFRFVFSQFKKILRGDAIVADYCTLPGNIDNDRRRPSIVREESDRRCDGPWQNGPERRCACHRVRRRSTVGGIVEAFVGDALKIFFQTKSFGRGPVDSFRVKRVGKIDNVPWEDATIRLLPNSNGSNDRRMRARKFRHFHLQSTPPD